MSAADDQLNPRTWLCSVVWADIVKYSRQSVEVQIDWKGRFSEYLRHSIDDVAESDRVVVDTGDGAAICFLGDPVAAMFCAVKLRDALLRDRPQQTHLMRVRFGINLGSVKLMTAITGNTNAVGNGINIAQRIMSFAEDDHILVSRSYYDVVSCLSESYNERFHYAGVRQDKHVLEHSVYELMPPENATPNTPKKASTEACPVSQRVKPALVTKAEHLLTVLLGPIARHLTRSHAARSSTPDEFVRALAGFITSKAEYDEFLGAMGFHSALNIPPPTDISAPAPTSGDTPVPSQEPALDSECLKLAQKELAEHIGPMAKVIIAQASAKARTKEELFQLLAAEISSTADRARFLAWVAENT